MPSLKVSFNVIIGEVCGDSTPNEISNSFNSLILLLRSAIDVLCVFYIVPSGANNSLE